MAHTKLKIPPASSESVHRSMVSNISRGTRLETKVREALKDTHIRGYRLNPSSIPGKPDIAFPRWRLAVFLHGCFWHRCPRCNIAIPKTHRSYWKKKLEMNVERDGLRRRHLESLGWKVVVIWEHEVREDLDSSVRRITNALDCLKAKAPHEQ
jgi:DNA mismatch endonuclease (patch repair protein)